MDYGWIGAVKPGKGSSRSQTPIAREVIRIATKKLGAENAKNDHDIARTTAARANNLLKYEGRYYYILGIGEGNQSWALSTFIREFKNKGIDVTLILLQAIESFDLDIRCNIWIADLDELRLLEKNEYNKDSEGVDGIPLRARTGAGDYYELNTSYADMHACIKNGRENVRKITSRSEDESSNDDQGGNQGAVAVSLNNDIEEILKKEFARNDKLYR